ncbi:MAG: fibronectin type III domain-containing protein [Byssovorax sp.]
MSIGRLRAIYGVNIHKITEVQARAQAMYDGLAADPVTYPKPTLPLPAFKALIQDLALAQQAVKTRVLGAREKRDAKRGLLFTGMEIERTFVQSLADADPAQAAALITNAGLVVAAIPTHTKAPLILRNGKQPGSVLCDANVGLLVGAGGKHPTQHRFFNWQYTVNGSGSFIALPPTSKGTTLVEGLTPLTMVGVRVSMTNGEGPGEWSQAVSILVL